MKPGRLPYPCPDGDRCFVCRSGIHYHDVMVYETEDEAIQDIAAHLRRLELAESKTGESEHPRRPS